MLVTSLLEAVCDKINTEISNLMSDSDYQSLIENNLSDELHLENYNSLIDEYLNIVNILKNNSLEVKFSLKNVLLILKKINSIEDNIDIDIEFKCCSINKDIIENIYLDNEEIHNVYLHENKIAIISICNAQFNNYLSELENQEDINSIFYLLKAFYDNFDYEKEQDKNRIIFLSNCTENEIENYTSNLNELVSYIKLCILSEGKSFHKHYTLNNSMNTLRPSCSSDKKYYQYNEILFILSEYNFSKDILNKYFLLYTIIENFMYRYPISYMTRNTRDFSIRDFKYFYSKIDSNELSKLKELFEKFMSIEYTHGNKIYDEITNQLDIFESTYDQDLVELIKFLLKIRVYDKNQALTKNQLKTSFSNKYFPEIIYQLRNSILHNTATEFHITHYMLEKHTIIFTFLKEFMIPVLEKLVLHMIYTNEATITYADNKLLLFEE